MNDENQGLPTDTLGWYLAGLDVLRAVWVDMPPEQLKALKHYIKQGGDALMNDMMSEETRIDDRCLTATEIDTVQYYGLEEDPERQAARMPM